MTGEMTGDMAGEMTDGTTGGVAGRAGRPLLGPGTLGRQLLVRVGVVLAVVLVGFAGLTVLVLRQTIVASFDRALDDAFARQQQFGVDAPQVRLPPGQPVGTVVVRASNDGIQGGVLTGSQGSGPGVAPLTLEAARALLTGAGPHKRTLHVPGYGRYRVMAQAGPEGVSVVGLPMGPTDEVLRAVFSLEAALAVVSLGVATLIVRRLVSRSVAPLHDMARTAAEVSELDLAHGEVALPARVADTHLDPRNEVDQVATSMNRLLGHVESSLAARQASETNVRQFVADASHELRNPLAAIRGYAELTRHARAELPADTAHALARIEAESERMSALVEDLLLLARLDANPRLDRQPVDTSALVADATADAQAAGPDHDWEVRLPEEPLIVWADQHRLHQVVANLLANARHHTPAGTHVVASVRAEPVGGGPVAGGPTGGGPGPAVVIEVSDDGPGIPPETVDRVFERFARGDAGRARRGAARHDSTGLGLAIVAAVVAAHGGTTRVTSRPGRTTFSVVLPPPDPDRPG